MVGIGELQKPILMLGATELVGVVLGSMMVLGSAHGVVEVRRCKASGISGCMKLEPLDTNELIF